MSHIWLYLLDSHDICVAAKYLRFMQTGPRLVVSVSVCIIGVSEPCVAASHWLWLSTKTWMLQWLNFNENLYYNEDLVLKNMEQDVEMVQQLHTINVPTLNVMLCWPRPNKINEL